MQNQLEKLIWLDKNLKPIWDNETIKKICDVLNKKQSIYLNDEYFLLEIQENKSRIQIKSTLTNRNGQMAYPIECIFIKDEDDKQPSALIADTLMDYIDTYWTEYLQDERNVFLPLDWSKHTYENIDFYMRGFVRNLELEAAAESLFQKHGYGDHDIHPISSET